jgi:transcriptional regulator with XRE-family HTH domain
MTISNLLTDDAVLEELGRRLAHTRLERNVSQAELAAEAGISKTTLERIERGDPVQINNFVRVLRALGQLDELDHVVPEPLPRPLERLSLEGKRRKRARRHRGDLTQPVLWSWDPDKAP